MNKTIQKRKKKYLEMEKKYRLENPFYNYVYKYDPKLVGFLVGFMSGFVWHIVFPEYMNVHISVCTISSGLIAWLCARQSQKEFEKEKKRQGFREDEWFLE
jgi:hypothetical protein|tara:strand:+ start:348 stop:650 length:303 start_codon:yes stop_codon:yes gene_type:complete